MKFGAIVLLFIAIVSAAPGRRHHKGLSHDDRKGDREGHRGKGDDHDHGKGERRHKRKGHRGRQGSASPVPTTSIPITAPVQTTAPAQSTAPSSVVPDIPLIPDVPLPPGAGVVPSIPPPVASGTGQRSAVV